MSMQNARFEILALGVFAAILVAMTVSGATTSAFASQGSSCSLSFNGSYLTLDKSPAGNWSLTSSSCSITSEANGITSGTFSGTLQSGSTSLVTGTWSVSGSSTQVTGSGVESSISFTVNTPVDQLPVIGSSYEGVSTGSVGQMLLTSGITGQVSLS
jgi:hypothetical protein